MRDDPERVKAALAKRGPGVADQVDRLLEADAERRRLVTEVEALRAEQKRRGREVAKAAPDERERVLAGLRELSDRLDAAEDRLRAADATLAEVQARMPNPPEEAVPAGGEEDAVELRRVGTPETSTSSATIWSWASCWARSTPSGRPRCPNASATWSGRGAARARPGPLRHGTADGGRVRAHGPPVLVRREAMFGTGFLPTDEQQIFRTADDDLYLAGTSEVPLVSYHSDELLDPATLPLRYAGFSSCFRREAGSYGKDTQGIFRVHQFDKVEMVSFVLPEDSAREHELLLAREEEILQALELPYRVVDIAAGDLGGSAAASSTARPGSPPRAPGASHLDLELHRLPGPPHRLPGQRARRQPPPHTLNGTAVAVGRTIVALLENHQQPDGSVRVPSPSAPTWTPT